ncbi:unnamed protein product [Pleuronectes platessa]|uniref:Uncharacterized protein n=1 Tax=Pleuronectes platessa TaxID=8262 RepID=A0A9N7YVP6_PLEPL|nr:unnamed protein product [Pleuronectes platessa]
MTTPSTEENDQCDRSVAMERSGDGSGEHDVQSMAIQEMPTDTCYMRLSIVLHQKEPRAHCTRISSDNHSEDFFLVAAVYDMAVCATPQGHASKTITDPLPIR